jgi:hypothetical protein
LRLDILLLTLRLVTGMNLSSFAGLVRLMGLVRLVRLVVLVHGLSLIEVRISVLLRIGSEVVPMESGVRILVVGVVVIRGRGLVIVLLVLEGRGRVLSSLDT